MRIRRQWKVLTRIVAALATAVTVGYGYTAHHAVIEYWHIMRLHAYRPEVRKEAAGVLGELKALRAVPYLVGVLESDEDKAVREEAMLALGEMGPKVGKNAIRAVVESLKDYVINGWP